MGSERDRATYYAGGRVTVGIVLLLFPERALRGMLRSREQVTPLTKMLARMVGARDLIIGAGTLAALQEGTAAKADDLRPWMTYGAAADAVDALAFLFAYRHLPARRRFAMVLVALAGAGTGGYLATTLSD
jgi:hypothetical protein